MKKVFAVVLLAFFLLSFSACTSLNNPREAAVLDALKFRNGTAVKLTGEITSFLLFEYYLFSDGTDSISLEVNAETWETIGVADPAELRFPARYEVVGKIDKRPNEEALVNVVRIRRL